MVPCARLPRGKIHCPPGWCNAKAHCTLRRTADNVALSIASPDSGRRRDALIRCSAVGSLCCAGKLHFYEKVIQISSKLLPLREALLAKSDPDANCRGLIIFQIADGCRCTACYGGWYRTIADEKNHLRSEDKTVKTILGNELSGLDHLGAKYVCQPSRSVRQSCGLRDNLECETAWFREYNPNSASES
jgi:hypothetical protein